MIKYAIVEPFLHADGDFDVAVIRHGFTCIKEAEKVREQILKDDETAEPQNILVIQYDR